MCNHLCRSTVLLFSLLAVFVAWWVHRTNVTFVPKTSERPKPSASGHLAAATLPSWIAVAGGPETGCSHGDDWAFMVRPGRADRLVVEFEGGGCCFDWDTCLLPIYTKTVSVDKKLSTLKTRGGIGGAHEGNPITNWTHVFVPYCTGDAHMGNHTAAYGVHHVGRVNFEFAMDWVHNNMGDLRPEVVFVTGESAGSVASYVLAPWVFERYPTARHVHLGDSYAPLFGVTGYNGGVKHWLSQAAFHPKVRDRLQAQYNVTLDKWTPFLAAKATAATVRVNTPREQVTYVSGWHHVHW